MEKNDADVFRGMRWKQRTKLNDKIPCGISLFDVDDVSAYLAEKTVCETCELGIRKRIYKLN